jgi:hypothetical protein
MPHGIVGSSRNSSWGWTASHLVGRPKTSLWIGQFFARPDEATKGRKGIFIYRPSIEFDMWGPGLAYIPNEFAVAEQEHYFTAAEPSVSAPVVRFS